MFLSQVGSMMMMESWAMPMPPRNTNIQIKRPRRAPSDRFIMLAIKAMVPILMAKEPRDNRIWGGLTIFTSRP